MTGHLRTVESFDKYDAARVYFTTNAIVPHVGDEYEAQDHSALHITKVAERDGIRTIGYVRVNDPSGRVSFVNYVYDASQVRTVRA